MAEDLPPPNVRIQRSDSVPPGGVYANVVAVWYTGDEFTLEFAVLLSRSATTPRAAEVARVKLPPKVAWDLAKIISHRVDAFEAEHGYFTPRPPDEREGT